MRLVLTALRRPVTVVAALIAIALSAWLAVLRMPVDIFPQVGDPAIYVAQPYSGMDPAQMEGYLTYYYEYHFLYITGIDHVESKSIQGAALMKLVFHQGTNMSQAMSETVGYVNRARSFMPPGAVPPFITRFDAGSVAVGLLVFRGPNHTQAEMQDYAINRVRPLFATLPGVSAPPPFGGNQKTIVVTLDPAKLAQYHISPEEAIAAVSKSTVVMPSGNMWTGKTERIARTNAALGANLNELMDTPVRPVSGPSVYLRDIGSIEAGADILTAYAHVNGKRTVYIPVTKRADASTLAVINAVKAAMPAFKRAVPEDVDVSLEFDQSPFVTNSLRGLVYEGLLGALLTGLMVLLFLHDWRSALIVVTNIPFALLGAVVCLWITGQTINIMTLGGLALSVGILVDEATVEIENIHTRMLPGVSRARAVLEACSRTATARFLSMLSILAVFVPSFFMAGVARQLFTPLALSVTLSVAVSYILSSSLVPVFSTWIMRLAHLGEEREGFLGRLRAAYENYLGFVLRFRLPLAAVYFLTSFLFLFLAFPRIGTELFPDTNARVFRLRLRAPAGTRIEETERLVLRALDVIKQTAGPQNIKITSDFEGLIPSSYPVDLIHLFTSGPEDAIIQFSLKPGAPGGEPLRERLRAALTHALPESHVSFEAGDLVTQVMSFGSPTPVEVAVQGVSLDADYTYARLVHKHLAKLPFLRDLQFSQQMNYPTLDITIDRARAGQFGLTIAEVTHSVVPATSSSRFTDPNFWRDPNTGNAFQIQVQLPQNQLQSIAHLASLPVMRPGNSKPLLEDIATLKPGAMPGELDRYNGQHVISLTANIHNLTLGQAVPEIQRVLNNLPPPPRGVTVLLRGEAPALGQTLRGLRTGLLLAILMIFLLLTAYFQSARLALTVVLTVPAVLDGALAMLLVTSTTLNIQSFLGGIMATGIAVANSILLVTFAERFRAKGDTAEQAARGGAASRLRAILMTASAMILGMAPMAIGFGEGGPQAAPLGRTVTGGLIVATFATLTILPALYAILQTRASTHSPSLDPGDPLSRYYDGK
jgi:multidrug efflux pump subunit AcrB